MFFSLKVSSFVISNMFLPSIVLLRNAIFKSPSLLRDFHIGIFIQFNTTNMQILIVFETFFSLPSLELFLKIRVHLQWVSNKYLSDVLDLFLRQHYSVHLLTKVVVFGTEMIVQIKLTAVQNTKIMISGMQLQKPEACLELCQASRVKRFGKNS